MSDAVDWRFTETPYNISDRLFPLLGHFLKLLTDDRTVKTIDGDVKPIAFFPFHYEVGLKICGIGFVVARLRDQVDQQTPRPRLCALGERPRKGVFAVLIARAAGRSGQGVRGQAGDVSPAHCRLGSCGGHNGVSRGRRPKCVENLKAAICRFENCGENDRLPGIETDDSSADRSAIVGEEIKQSRVRVVGWIRWGWARVAVWIVRVLKIDDKIRAATGVAIVSGVKDAVGPTKFPHTAGGVVDGIGRVGEWVG